MMRVIAFYFNTSKNFTYTSRHDSVSIYVNLRHLRHFKIHMLMHIQYGCCRRVTDAHKVLAARWRANQILGQYLYKDAPAEPSSLLQLPATRPLYSSLELFHANVNLD